MANILLIDDDPNLILLVKDYLEFRGYKVLTAANGREALKIVEQEPLDMIILVSYIWSKLHCAEWKQS